MLNLKETWRLKKKTWYEYHQESVKKISSNKPKKTSKTLVWKLENRQH